MCCFTQPVVVSGTEIFARRSSPTSQILVYTMKVKAKDDVAMILPIPVPKGTPESAVKFLDLSKYPEFFQDLSRGFSNRDPSATREGGAKGVGSAAAHEKPLKVVGVGNFEASFVPTIDDFGRLAAQFRLPKKVWASLPQYEKFGFAVFKLKAKHKAFHPMAFEFPTTYVSELFFPTVHVHDGKVHEKAHFDHSLYCQVPDGVRSLAQWEESDVPVGMYMDYTRGLPAIERFSHVMRLKMEGQLKNQDTIAG